MRSESDLKVALCSWPLKKTWRAAAASEKRWRPSFAAHGWHRLLHFPQRKPQTSSPWHKTEFLLCHSGLFCLILLALSSMKSLLKMAKNGPKKDWKWSKMALKLWDKNGAKRTTVYWLLFIPSSKRYQVDLCSSVRVVIIKALKIIFHFPSRLWAHKRWSISIWLERIFPFRILTDLSCSSKKGVVKVMLNKNSLELVYYLRWWRLTWH